MAPYCRRSTATCSACGAGGEVRDVEAVRAAGSGAEADQSRLQHLHGTHAWQGPTVPLPPQMRTHRVALAVQRHLLAQAEGPEQVGQLLQVALKRGPAGQREQHDHKGSHVGPARRPAGGPAPLGCPQTWQRGSMIKWSHVAWQPHAAGGRRWGKAAAEAFHAPAPVQRQAVRGAALLAGVQPLPVLLLPRAITCMPNGGQGR